MAARVLVVDPEPFFAEGLANALEASGAFSVAGQTSDERHAEQLTDETMPDIVITEVPLDAGSGLSLARRIRDRARVVVLTRASEGDVLLDCADVGAYGCVSHDVGLEEFVALLARAADGGFAIADSRLRAALVRASGLRAHAVGAAAKLARLSAREREVLQLLAQGHNNEDIGAALYLSPQTARTHVGNILRKLEVHSRAEAVRVAVKALSAGPVPQVLRIEGPELGRP